MNIYYAHSRTIYGTPREGRERRIIEGKFQGDNKLVCPNRDLGELGSLKPYLAVVGICDLVVCSEIDGLVGLGVYSEVDHALKLNKTVYVLRRSKLFRVNGRFVVDADDWIRYGKLKAERTARA